MVKARTALSITQEAAAERSGLSLRFYQDMEAGKKSPSIITLVALARSLKCDYNTLFAGCDGLERR